MSMVGYVLGLGDRHPSNLMLDRMSGKNHAHRFWRLLRSGDGEREVSRKDSIPTDPDVDKRYGSESCLKCFNKYIDRLLFIMTFKGLIL